MGHVSCNNGQLADLINGLVSSPMGRVSCNATYADKYDDGISFRPLWGV